jgi:hypothetical protein
MGDSTVKDPWFKKTGLTLKDWGFNLLEQSEPDPKHFGNWILIGVRNNLALRVIRDRGSVNFDLMPAALFKPGASESDWYNWDVVARLGILQKSGIEPLVLFHDHLEELNRAFAPENWERTRGSLAYFEDEKRRRFTDRKVPA